jgi:Flp pilus assembly protein TadG
MTARSRKPRGTQASGQSVAEFGLISFMMFVLVFGVIEMGRVILVYTTVANAARAGVRYAVVHGSSRTAGSASSNASGPSSNPAQVLTVVKNFASAGALTAGNLVISVTYPGASNAPGQLVSVSVIYPYDPLTTYLPFRVRLGSVAEGVIAY